MPPTYHACKSLRRREPVLATIPHQHLYSHPKTHYHMADE